MLLHHRALAVLTPEVRRARYREIERILPPTVRDYPISRELARLLSHLIIRLSLTRVLEFGAGVSSLIIASSLKKLGGGHLTSIENEPRYCRKPWEALRKLANVDAQLVVTTLRSRIVTGRRLYVHAGIDEAIAARAPYDIVLIDGPRAIYGREGMLHQAWSHLCLGALVILDDVGRQQEREVLRSWLTQYPNLYPLIVDPCFGGRGVAVLQVLCRLSA